MRHFRKIPLEAMIWLSGLLFLAFYPLSDQTHFTICPLKLTGVDGCPGCGLGQSVSWFFRGEWERSFNAHPLGIFAIIVLSYRIIILTKNYLKNYGQSN